MGSPDKFKKRVGVTGGAGFIGSNLLLHLVPEYPEYLFINLDCLTYAGNLSNLAAIENSPNYVFEKVDIRQSHQLRQCFMKYAVDSVIHLAAESHVDRSIHGPADFIQTNIIGTFNLLELAREKIPHFRFLHVSTDEVFGSLEDNSCSTESTPYNPNSPYSASKAAADHLVRAYHQTYGLDTVTANSSNNFGPYQFPEKIIPLTIINARNKSFIPIYGDGENVRDWLYVKDHCRALDLAFHYGRPGQTYNIGASNQLRNIDVVERICGIMDSILGDGPYRKLIKFVKDRPGHDRRYAVDASRLETQLHWKPQFAFDDALRSTVEWYLDNWPWVENCTTGDYRKYYSQNYENR